MKTWTDLGEIYKFLYLGEIQCELQKNHMI